MKREACSRFKISLKIADIIIQLKSKFMMESLSKRDSWRFGNFIYKEGPKSPHISLEVRILNKLPKLGRPKRIFLTKHPDSNETNWALFKNKRQYILRQYGLRGEQHIELNPGFNKGLVYLLKDKQDNSQWKISDIIYDALQVILISYLTNRDGIFTHAIGLKDIDKKGLLFAGKSGQGKSATARLWHKYSQATVLNDDRIIIRKKKGNFYIYGSPWHGDFSDYLLSRIDEAKLARLFFIYHSRKNSVRPLLKKSAFRLLYPSLFPPFWDKEGLERMIGFSQELIENVPCFRLGFKNTKEVIGYVRKIATTETRKGK